MASTVRLGRRSITVYCCGTTPNNAASSPSAQTASKQRRQQHTHASPRRRIHSTAPQDVALEINKPSLSYSTTTAHSEPTLSQLPLSQILRTYFMTSISSSPLLLGLSTRALRGMLDSNNPIFDLRNPVMRTLLRQTFYKQFCAGWDRDTITQSTEALRQMGYAGVILEYALEVLQDDNGSDEGRDVAMWREGMLNTVDMAARGDFLGLKWSGMGPAAMRRMKNQEPPSRDMDEAMHTVCKAAAAKNIALLPSAEETWSLQGFHDWCLALQRAYNRNGKSVVYNTYQAYLKQNPHILSKHLQQAKDDGFTLGVKVVRGAYLGSEKRDLIWPDIDATHAAYDFTASALVHRSYNDLLRPSTSSTKFPEINVMIATHNAATVEKTQTWRREQAARGEELTPLVFAQLQGMADEVSCALLASSNATSRTSSDTPIMEKVYKCTTWGTMSECLNYLLRRAAENKDAAGRTAGTRDAMGKELRRRLWAGFAMN